MEHDRSRPIPAVLDELAELARHAPGRLGQRLGALAISEQAELALLLAPRERLELLLHSPQSMRLVRSLPDSELYLTVRELGPSDALPLVALSSASQLGHLIDLESWRGDRFDADRSGAWLALFVEAGEPTIRRFLRHADDEMLALLFQSWLRVEPVDTDDEPGARGPAMGGLDDEQGFLSPDGHHRFTPTIPDHAVAARRLVQIFCFDQPDRYRSILWAAQRQLLSELEEESLHWRQSRLEEHGFPPWEEALAVYAPPSGERHGATTLAGSLETASLVPPGAPLRLESGAPLLHSSLDALPGDVRARVLGELVSLANRVMIADRSDTGDPAAHRAALERAAGSVAIALELRRTRQTDPAAELLAKLPLLELFREGHGLALELQRRGRVLVRDGWPARHPRALELLDAPLAERVLGLLESRPLYFQLRSGAGALRAFRTLGEIEETRNSIELVEVLGELFVARLGLDLSRVFEISGPRPDPPRLSTFLLTLLAWHSQRSELRSDPLPGDVVAGFLHNVASVQTAEAGAAARALEDLLAGLDRTLGLPVRSLAVLRGFGRASLERLAAECGSLDPDAAVDPRFVSCLLLSGK